MRQYPSVVIPSVNPQSISEVVADRTQELAIESGQAWLWLYKRLNRFVITPTERTIWRGERLWCLGKNGSALLVGCYDQNVAANDVMDDVLDVLCNMKAA